MIGHYITNIYEKASVLISGLEGTEFSHHHQKGLHSHLTWKELNPLTMTECPALTSNMEGTKSSHHDRMAPSPRLSYLVTDQVPPFSQRMAVALVSGLVGNKPYTLTIMAFTHI